MEDEELQIQVGLLATRTGVELRTINAIIAGLRESTGLTGELGVPGAESFVDAIARLDALLAASTDIDDAVTSSQTAWSSYKTDLEIATAIADLVGTVPDVLNTLEKIATLLQSETGVLDALEVVVQNNANALSQAIIDYEAADTALAQSIVDAIEPLNTPLKIRQEIESDSTHKVITVAQSKKIDNVSLHYAMDSFTDLVSDTGIHSDYGDGAIIKTHKEGFTYIVAPLAAVDHHISTAGGVKLYVSGSPDGRYPLGAFGPINTSNDTATFQNAVSVISDLPQGGTLCIPAGQFTVGDLVIPGGGDGCVNIEGSQAGTELIMYAGSSFIFDYLQDYDRRGGKSLKNIRFNGQDNGGASTDCVGIRVNGMLQMNIENVFVENCDTAIVLDSIQECVFTNVIASRSRIGWYMMNPFGGLTISQFIRCAAQDNLKVGWLVDGGFVAAAAHTLSWDACLLQVNRFCAFYATNLGQGHITNAHIEWNAREGSASETVVVPASVGGKSYTIEKAVIHVDNETHLEISNTEIPESVSTTVMRITNESIIVADGVGGTGLVGADFVKTDFGSEFKAMGMLSTFCGGGYYHTWPRTMNFEFRSIMYGTPIYQQTNEITNEIAATHQGLTGTPADATVGTAFDSITGRCFSLQFTSQMGSLNVNRFRGTVWTGDTLNKEDKCIFTTLARIQSGAVKQIIIDNVGTGYTSATVSITGGGGTGATATAQVSDGELSSITMTNEGSGYTSIPTVSISGDGTLGTASPIVGADVTFQQPLSIALTRQIRLTLDWQRIVFWGLNTNPSTAQLYVWASDTSASLLYLSKYQSYRVPNSRTQRRKISILNRILSEGLVNNKGLGDVKITANKTYAPGVIANNASVSTTVTLNGAAFGDIAYAAINSTSGLLGAAISAHVSAADVVTVVITNNTGASVSISVGNLVATVVKQ